MTHFAVRGVIAALGDSVTDLKVGIPAVIMTFGSYSEFMMVASLVGLQLVTLLIKVSNSLDQQRDIAAKTLNNEKNKDMMHKLFTGDFELELMLKPMLMSIWLIIQTNKQAGRLENVVGWYHSHLGYGCWLSGIDVSTQMLNQQFQEPFLAVVIDPTRTVSAGKVEIGAFRTYPEGYKPPAEPVSEY
ncbi:hypothetical protein IFM89_021384 [Coptis chinensis]|uniref:COP9 signalosome complex subunit 5 n=1 Tax=Coptis chinensis TaxID=261450 RepID=A0A835ID45_9MAGN|nr:hypothetical protein IFM89_021384 [Coptis chinensis]